jgi:hypothetical protein
MTAMQRLRSLVAAALVQGVSHVAVIGPTQITPAQCPIKDVQPTSRAPRPVEFARTTAVSNGGLILLTYSSCLLDLEAVIGYAQ